MKPTQAQIEAAHRIRNWLGRNGTAETNPEKKAAFIEAHNAALKIIEEAALTAAAEVNEHDRPDARRSDLCNNNGDNPRFETSQQPDRSAQIEAALLAANTAAAEVGERQHDHFFINGICSHCGQTTVEVGEQNHDYMRGYVDGGKETKAATIERCAQVADSNAVAWQKQEYKWAAELIARDIRALKDKP